MKNSNPIDYRMSKQMFNAILATRKGNETKLNPYTYVMNYVNDTFGIRGTVKHISLFE